MHRPLRSGKYDMAARRLAVDRAGAKIKASEPCVAPTQSRDELFENFNQGVLMWRSIMAGEKRDLSAADATDLAHALAFPPHSSEM